MLKSCKYCGRIHSDKYKCKQKEKAIQMQKSRKCYTDADGFRYTALWQKKRNEIRERDKQVCQVCIRGLYNPDRVYETDNLSVHHIRPIISDWDNRLDNNNLITLCRKHHEMAESGEISQEELLMIAKEQEDASSYID